MFYDTCLDYDVYSLYLYLLSPITSTHNLTVSENVAYDTRGHCFMLEDGGGECFCHDVGDISV